AVVRRFGEREHRLLAQLFRLLGSHNDGEHEAARRKIDDLLRQFGRTWADLMHLLASGTRPTINSDLARDIAALRSDNPNGRGNACGSLADFLERGRQSWYDLTDPFCSSPSSSSWASSQSAWPPRVNPLDLACHVIDEYVALRPHESMAM